MQINYYDELKDKPLLLLKLMIELKKSIAQNDLNYNSIKIYKKMENSKGKWQKLSFLDIIWGHFGFGMRLTLS